MIVIGRVMGLTAALQGGAFAGSMTSTPALAAATAKAASNEPAVGYALTYPVGVVMTIVAVSIILNRTWRSPKDPPPLAGQPLVDFTVEVQHPDADGGRARVRRAPGPVLLSVPGRTIPGWSARTRNSSAAIGW